MQPKLDVNYWHCITQFCFPVFVTLRNLKLTTCQKLTIETLEQGTNVFKVNNKDTEWCKWCSVFIASFEQVTAGWNIVKKTFKGLYKIFQSNTMKCNQLIKIFLIVNAQQTFICSKATIEILEKGVKCVQN